MSASTDSISGWVVEASYKPRAVTRKKKSVEWKTVVGRTLTASGGATVHGMFVCLLLFWGNAERKALVVTTLSALEGVTFLKKPGGYKSV